MKLVAILCATQAASYFITEHVLFFAKMTGSKATNALSALIFNKTLKISAATNKKFSLGQIVNFVQADALRMQFLMQQAPMILKLPYIIVLCFAVLFFYLGFSFLSAIVIFVMTFLTNTYLSRVTARLQKQLMKQKDARIKAITESLGNIKVLKMYGWTQIFQNIISEKRADELALLWKRFRLA